MFLTRKLAVSVNYIVSGALNYNDEEKNVVFLKEVHFVESTVRAQS